MESRFEQVLRHKISEEIDKSLDLLSQTGAKDYAEYREYFGYIRALRAVFVLFDETHKDLSGE